MNNHVQDPFDNRIVPDSTKIGCFNILDYLDKLTPNEKQKGKYYCPVCGGNDLSIHPKTGAYSCFSNACKSKDIRQAISPLPQGRSRPTGARPKPHKTSREKEKEANLDAARGECKVNELTIMVIEGSLTECQARNELATWANSQDLSAYTLGRLFDEKLNDNSSRPNADALEKELNAIEAVDDPKIRWELEQEFKLKHRFNTAQLKEFRGVLKLKTPTDNQLWAMPIKEFAELDLGSNEWLFDGLLPANKSILLVADSKTGKSLLGYDWVYSLVTGEPWGDFRTDKPRKVLIVQTDESEIDCQERIIHRGINSLDNVRIIRDFSPLLMGRLTRFIEDWKPDVILFDSLTSIQRDLGISPKDPEYANWLYDLKNLAAKYQVTPIIITHTNKAPVEAGLTKVFGTHIIAAAVSEIFLLTRPKDPVDDCDRVLVHTGSRTDGSGAWLISLNVEDYSWEYRFPCNPDGSPLEGPDRESKTADYGNLRDQARALLSRHGGWMTSEEIADGLGIARITARKLCKTLTDSGMVKRDKRGRKCIYQHVLSPIA